MNNLKIGFFLATRQIKRSSRWTTALIVSVMILTFLNLVVVSGILVGLIQGAVDAVRIHQTSDIIISPLNNKYFIENSPAIIGLLNSEPAVDKYSARYIKGGSLEADYNNPSKETEKRNTANASVTGIDPIAENKVTELSKFIVEGEYLAPTDFDQVLLGAYLIKRYMPIDSPGFATLSGDIAPGSKIRLLVGDIRREVVVKGILQSKVDEINMRVYMVDSQFRGMINRDDYSVNEIAVKIKDGESPDLIRDSLIGKGASSMARVQTFEDASPKFIKDMIQTFAILGNLISSIGLVVASITIFIVIFINALTRRKFIGILKGIGISGQAIEISYVLQSFFYAIVGSIIGFIVVYAILQPYMAAHPINFPFSDGILVAPLTETLLKIALLIISTIIAGYIPARMIVRKNTLDSILGRK